MAQIGSYSRTTRAKLRVMLAELSHDELLGFVREHLPKRARTLLRAELTKRVSPNQKP